MTPARLASLLLPGLLAACGAPAPSPEAPAAPSREAPAARLRSLPTSAVPTSPAVAPSATAPAPPTPPAPVLAEPLPPLARRFVSIAFHRSRSGIVAVPDGTTARKEGAGLPRADVSVIVGQSPRDLWLLADSDGETFVLHFDGDRVLASVKPCGFPRFSWLSADREGVHAAGSVQTNYGNRPLRASLDKGGKWFCELGETGEELPGERDSGPLHTPAYGGPPVPPNADGSQPGKTPTLVALQMAGPTDGWQAIRDAEDHNWLFRYNGVAWAPVPAFDSTLTMADLWADEAGHAWLLTTAARAPVLRFDEQGASPLPVPASFSAKKVSGTGPRDVWFFGEGDRVYQWDGDRLRQGKAPFTPTDAFRAPGGELWILGDGKIAHTAALPEAR